MAKIIIKNLNLAKNITRNLALTLLFFLIGFVAIFVPQSTHAADIDFSDAITVDSTLDTPDSNVGDGICDDGSGNCTLRAAIEESNAIGGTQTIGFNISGPASFVNAGQNGYTIQPTSALPSITDTVTIDGYSQPGSQTNTAAAPNPLNGRLLIEIDGSQDLTESSIILDTGSDNSVIRGLVINGFRDVVTTDNNRNAFIFRSDYLIFQGNYLGTDPTGSFAKNNNVGITYSGSADESYYVLIGGTDPADRNIISGNSATSGNVATGMYPGTGWRIKGNYIGVGADGMTAIPNSVLGIGGPGSMSIDYCSDVVVGGPEDGATNVISGNNSFGIFPDKTDNLVIQGNIIGPDWQGNPIPGYPQNGGIGFPPVSGSFTNTLIGGAGANEGNLIAYNNGPGVAVVDAYLNGAFHLASDDITIIGNRIFGNNAGGLLPLSNTGLAIDLLAGDFVTLTITEMGHTLNDAGDGDSGANGYLNFPVISSAIESGSTVTIMFDLDASGSPSDQYRVEFFASDAADSFGYGEGQYFLGSTTVSPGNGQSVSLTLPSGFSVVGKNVSATTTEIDTSTLTGFGSTSEFSSVVVATQASVAPQTPSESSLPDSSNGSNSVASSGDSLAATGHNISFLFYQALYLMLVGALAVRFGRNT